jgi:hypothetical protein
MARRSFACAVLLTFGLVGAGCARDGFDWDRPEDIMLEKKVDSESDGAVRMEFVSLVNAPADRLYEALKDVEHHEQFIDGVTESKVVGTDGRKKIVEIDNRVLGRPNHAKIEWTFDDGSRKAAFKTLEAEFTDNSATYAVEPSPDGKRARITTVYHLRDKGGHPFPLHSLKLAIEDGYAAAVRGVKRRALGSSAVVAR